MSITEVPTLGAGALRADAEVPMSSLSFSLGQIVPCVADN
jgi:hypothetical protein